MSVERDFHMAKGDGETSYAKNSKMGEKAYLLAKPIVEKVATEVYMALLPKTMVTADLGCSSGPNTLLFVSDVINVISDHCSKLGERDHTELQFFLNDLPGNDFNQLFSSVQQFKISAATNYKGGETLPPYYISGLPDSFYTRLFPRQTVHLFHSMLCLHWLSQVPEGLHEGKSEPYPNDENIYITNATSVSVVKLFQEQFQKDFSVFLRLRHEELVFGGQMVLTFCGRKDEDVFSGDLNHLFGLVAQSLQTLVAKGIVGKEKLESFYLPLYGPSVGEVKTIVKQSELFDVGHIELVACNWDANDDSEGDVVGDSVQSGVNVAKHIRSVVEALIAGHFGETILDTLFTEYARRVAEHLEREKTRYSFIILSLKKRG